MVHTIVHPSSPFPYITSSPTIASDFRAWGYRVSTYSAQHPYIVSLQRIISPSDTTLLLAMPIRPRIEDVWCAERARRRIQGGDSEEEVEEPFLEESGFDFGGLGLGAENFTQGVVGRRQERQVEERYVERALGLGRSDVGEDGTGAYGNRSEGAEEGGDSLPMYSPGEEPPAYCQ